ncbi:MAG: slipin family protein, partial [Acidobacteria bacterium]
MTPTLIGLGLAILFVVFLIAQAVRILPEYERGVVFRL